MTAVVDAATADPDRLAWAVVVDGRAVGSTSYLDVDLAVSGLEIGWTWYAREVWATHVNPACKRLLLGHAFDALGAQRVTLKLDALNTRSFRAVERLGARYDGTLRHHRLRADGTVRDSAYFSILATEWPAVREGLDARLA
jgi:N-acetyltransferase